MSVRLHIQFAVLVTLISLSIDSISRAADAAPPTADETSQTLRRQKIERALNKVISVDFVETPLIEVAAFLRNQLQIEIQLDNKALEDAGVPVDTPVSRTLHEISARSTLRYLLGSLDLTYTTLDDVLLITTPEKAGASLRTEVYSVNDLIKETNEFGEAIEDYQTLIDIVTTTLTPTTWDEVGGPGSIQGLQGNLIVSQIDETQHDIADLIAKIRQIKDLPADAEQPVSMQISGSDTPADKAVRAALERKVTFDFVNSPLEDVGAYLRKQLKIEVQLDSKALEDAGAGGDTPVNFKANDIRVATALNLMLQSLDLTYIVKDEVLLITTPEKADSELRYVLFPVRDLLDPALPVVDSLEKLSAVISTTVQPTIWDEVGGPCSVVPVAVAQAVLVSAHDTVLAEVTELLGKLRKSRDARKNDGADPVASQLQTRVYKLTPRTSELNSGREAEPPKPVEAAKMSTGPKSAEATKATDANIPAVIKRQPTPEEVADFLRMVVEPESWQRGNEYILALGDRLIVCQSPLLHRRIKRLLLSLELMEPKRGGGGLSFHSHTDSPTNDKEKGGGYFSIPH